MIITNIIDQLKRDEGFKALPYKDTEGNITIFHGHKVKPNESVGKLIQLGPQKVLIQDIDMANQQVLKQLPWTLTALDDARHGVLVNMCFNMGIFALLLFKNTLGCIKREDYDAAAAAMIESKWAKQVGFSAPCKEYPEGQRAWRLAEQMKTGVWR